MAGWNNVKLYENILINLKKFEADIMQVINLAEGNKAAIRPTKVYPMAKIQPLDVNGYPVLQFAYDGLLPMYLHNKKYKKLIRDYYFHCTLAAFDFTEIEGFFHEAVIIGCQYFKDDIVRDLDNRNFKYIQDAIRFSGVIRDDKWQNIWNMLVGFSDEERNHVQVYVVEKKHFGDFYNFLLDHHEELKKTNDFVAEQRDFLDLQDEVLENVENLSEEQEEELEDEGEDSDRNESEFISSLFSKNPNLFR